MIPKSAPEWEKVSLYITPELAKRLRQHYVDTRQPMSHLVRELVAAHFARRDARASAAKAKPGRKRSGATPRS